MIINWATLVITIEKSDTFMTLVTATQYNLDVNLFRLSLDDRLDDVDGEIFADTHIHATERVLGGVTYARSMEIINGYTVEFEDGAYRVIATGPDHNISDVMVFNNVSLVTNNSVGKQVVTIDSGSGLTEEQNIQLFKALTKSQFLGLK